MSFSRLCQVLLICVGLIYACYWATLTAELNYSDNPDPLPNAWMKIFYMADSLYYFNMDAGTINLDYYGHCDPDNNVIYWAKGYYQKSDLVQDHCTRTSLGLNPPPEPIVRCECQMEMEPGPVANAGDDRYVNIYVRDTLDASGSVPFNGRPIVKCHWRTRFDFFDTASITDVVLNDSLSANPWFILMVAGDYYFYLCIEDEYGLSAWDTVKVHACPHGEPCEDPAVEQPKPVKLSSELMVFPNPARALVTLVLPAGADQLAIYNIQGKVVKTYAALIAGVVHWKPRRTYGQGQGLYFAVVKLNSGKTIRSRPVVLIK